MTEQSTSFRSGVSSFDMPSQLTEAPESNEGLLPDGGLEKRAPGGLPGAQNSFSQCDQSAELLRVQASLKQLVMG